MTTLILIDCQRLTDDKDFYAQFAEQLQLDGHFGANLDALWDVLTTELALPIKIKFNHFESTLHTETLEKIIEVIKEAQVELGEGINLEFNVDQASRHLLPRK